VSLGAHTAATTGVVTGFDAAVGLGVLRVGDGTELGFHCTQIADGTRSIAVGTAVRFTLRAGRGGRWEAGDVTDTDAGSGPN
jgi:cold shock CspA family protein